MKKLAKAYVVPLLGGEGSQVRAECSVCCTALLKPAVGREAEEDCGSCQI